MRTAVIICLFFVSALAGGQCLTDVDFNEWQVLGNPAAEWFVLNDSTVMEYGDAQPPTFFVSPYSLINVKITGTMRVDWHNDADFVGLVFGYHLPAGTESDYRFILFDWKKTAESFQGIYANEGMTLSKVNRSMTYEQSWTYFWGHADDPPGFEVLARNYASLSGWDYNRDYHYELSYTSTRIIIAIDGEEVFNVTGCFEPGRFGFYSYSQQNSVFTNFNYRLRVDFLADREEICTGETVQFTVADPDCSGVPSNIESFEWDFGDGTYSSAVNTEHTFNTSGTYQVKLKVTDHEGCQDSTFATVTVHDHPVVDLGADTTVAYGSSLTLEGGDPGAVFEWSTGATTQSITLTDLKNDTAVSVVVSRNGCSGQDEILIRVEPAPLSRVFIPSAFTPDGDGRNDTFHPVLMHVEEPQLMVFDRWGKMLFRSSEQEIRWDGKCGSKPCPDGVYVWKLVYEARLEDDRTEQKVEAGTVMLVR
jgi:gliding motility-associated-like protein